MGRAQELWLAVPQAAGQPSTAVPVVHGLPSDAGAGWAAGRREGKLGFVNPDHRSAAAPAPA